MRRRGRGRVGNNIRLWGQKLAVTPPSDLFSLMRNKACHASLIDWMDGGREGHCAAIWRARRRVGWVGGAVCLSGVGKYGV